MNLIKNKTIMLVTKNICYKNKKTYFPIIDNIYNFSNKLTNEALKHKGFKDSQSFWDLTDPNKIITVSKWDSIDDWNDWYLSDNRKEIINLFNDLHIETNISHLRPKLLSKDIALL